MIRLTIPAIGTPLFVSGGRTLEFSLLFNERLLPAFARMRLYQNSRGRCETVYVATGCRRTAHRGAACARGSDSPAGQRPSALSYDRVQCVVVRDSLADVFGKQIALTNPVKTRLDPSPPFPAVAVT